MTAWRVSLSLASGAILLSLLAAASAAAQAPGGAPSGTFGNVRLSPETGDLGGLEIELHADQVEPYALVVYCEGWCNQAHRVPLRLNATGFEVEFAEPRYDSVGALVAEDKYRIQGQAIGDSLIVHLETNEFRQRFELKRQKERLGLAVADPSLESSP